MQLAKDFLNVALQRVGSLQQQQTQQQSGQQQSAAGLQTSRSGALPPTALSVTAPAAQPPEVRLQRFKQELLASTINIHNLKRLSFYGVPEHLRTIVWKLLLGYLPTDPEQWAQTLARRRTQYHIFCDELIMDPKRIQEAQRLSAGGSGGGAPGPTAASTSQPLGSSLQAAQPAAAAPSDPLQAEVHVPHPLQGEDVTSDDHPLSTSAHSKWFTYFQDSEVLAQVERDVIRTHPDMHFFTGEAPESEMHRQEMIRALFMYAKLNPGLRYIQGMNELIAPLYYLFKTDQDEGAREYAEADAFWCFMELISEFRDHFCQQLDNSQTGIRATIRKLSSMLQHHDYQLWHHIELVHKVDGQFYAFRWITLLLSQEFSFPDVLRIWDTILSDPHGRSDCLMRICLAMILNVRDILLQGDFTVIMKTLQRYPPMDVTLLLAKAAALPPCREVLDHR